MKLEHFLISYAKINSKWIKGLNVRLDTIKLLVENTDKSFFDINSNYIFLDLPPRVIKTKIHKWGLIKLEILLYSKENC